MINTYTLKLQLPEEVRINHLGSLLHGVLMELLPGHMVEFLHQQSFYNPLKQRIYFHEKAVVWEVVCFHEEIIGELDKILSDLSTFHIKYHQVDVEVIDYVRESYEIDDLIEKYFQDDESKRYVKLDILTPMSFKSAGKHEVLPNMRRFMRSIMIQYDGFFEQYKMHDHDTLEFIEQQVRIVDYRLRSTRFQLEGSKIPSFIGQMTVQINGPKQFRQLIQFLLFIGSFTGVGVKTTLGMGKYEIVN